MHKMGDEVHIDTDEARSGETPHIVRYVLMFSLLFAILALSAIWISGAMSQNSTPGRPMTAEEHALGG